MTARFRDVVLASRQNASLDALFQPRAREKWLVSCDPPGSPRLNGICHWRERISRCRKVAKIQHGSLSRVDRVFGVSPIYEPG